MRVLQASTKEATHTEIMANMEGGIGVEIATTFPLPCLIDMEDGTGPCWACVANWVDMSVEHSTTG